VHRKILRDSITNDELLMALNLALGNLTHVELAVSPVEIILYFIKPASLFLYCS
jgi:hypothetical protein